MSGAKFDYGFGQKNNWRRTMWNRIVERLNVRPRDAVVLYLAGPDDKDRAIALSKGFRNENLIAVDRDKSNAQKIRHGGNLSISGDLTEVIANWVNAPVHVLFGDFCCGLQRGPAQVALLASVKVEFQNCVCAFNMMRGRDRWKAEEFSEEKIIANSGDGDLNDVIIGQHRGNALFTMLSGFVFQNLENAKVLIDADLDSRLITEFFNREKPPLSSYRSSAGMMFDSIVYRNRSIHSYLDWREHLHSLSPFPKSEKEFTFIKARPGFDQDFYKTKMFNQILAVRATRTRKLQEAA